MAFLRSSSGSEATPVLTHGIATLRPPVLSDYSEWAELRSQSRAFLAPWEPKWPIDDLSRGSFRRRIRRYQFEMRDDHAYPFFIFRQSDFTLVGGITISNVCRGMTQCATLGYWIGEKHANQGYMSAAVRAVIPFAFDSLRLHRLEAACLPNNQPSMRLLENIGFVREGLARGLVCIDGVWRDHIVFATLSTDPPVSDIRSADLQND